MKTPDPNDPEMNTETAVINSLTVHGFTVQFKANEQGLRSLSTDKVYKPDEIKVVNFYRFEGDSNPADESIIYAIVTSDGEKGTLVDAYGPDNNAHVTLFMKQVEDFEKHTQKGEPL